MSTENDAIIEPDVVDSTPIVSSTNAPTILPYEPEANLSNAGADTHPIDVPTGASPIETTSTNMNSLPRGTLDESILKTLKRDVTNINYRLKQVVYPHFPKFVNTRISQSTQLSNDIASHCDLWAPLIFIICYSLAVSHAHSLFSSLFTSCWFILLVISFHLKLVKPEDSISLISYVSLAGYCIFPQVIQALLTQIILPLAFKPVKNPTLSIRLVMILKLILTAGSTMWSVTSLSLVSNCTSFISVYPSALCLFGLSWLATIL